MSPRRILVLLIIVGVVWFLLDANNRSNQADSNAYAVCKQALEATGAQNVQQARLIRTADTSTYRVIMTSSNGRYSCMAHRFNNSWNATNVVAVE